MPTPKRNPIQIQQDLVDTIMSAHARWSHRKGIKNLSDGIGGHYGRIVRSARASAIRKLLRWGYTYSVAEMLISDAHDIAMLEIRAN
jgi:hypothetical protein